MATNCAVYKRGILLGTGTVADGSSTISAWSVVSGLPAVARRNVDVTITGGVTHLGRTFSTRILTDNGATLTMKDPCPYVGA